MAKYNNGDPSGPIQLHKNESILGAFKNKLRVVSYAKPTNFIALIDSDNFVNRDYFEFAKKFIDHRQLRCTDHVVLCPYHTMSDFEFDFKEFVGHTIDYLYARMYSGFSKFHMLLNVGNYILTKCVYENLVFDDDSVQNAGPHDVIYKHVLAFHQKPKYRMFVVPDMTYLHVVHIKSLYLQTHQESLPFYHSVIIPQLCSL